MTDSKKDEEENSAPKSQDKKNTDKKSTVKPNFYHHGDRIPYPYHNHIQEINVANEEAEKQYEKKKPFYKKLRDYQFFEVQKVPYLNYINDYITYFKDKQAKNDKLLYFKNLRKIAQVSNYIQYAAWTFSLIFALVYAFTSPNYG